MSSLNKQQLARYSRHISLDEIGIRGQEALLRSAVLVIGAGGLGCPLLQYLVAAGVGTITVIDHDAVDLSNLQRQVLYSPSDIGQSKAKVAVSKLAQLNPDVKLIGIAERLTEGNARQLVKQVDLVIDGSDNFNTRYLVNDACVLENRPWVFGSIFRHQGQVTVFNYNGGPSYRCLFPEAPENVPSCSEAGVLGALTGTVGSLMAGEAIKVLSGAGDVLSGRLMLLDMLSSGFSFLEFSRSSSYNITDIKTENSACEVLYQDITPGEFLELKETIAHLDLRHPHEKQDEVKGSMNILFEDIMKDPSVLAQHGSLVLYCESGIRSAKAATKLAELYPRMKIYNLSGGMNKFRSTRYA